MVERDNSSNSNNEPQYESSIPAQITQQLLYGKEIPIDLPPLGSSTIEDFIIAQIKNGVIDPDTILINFLSENVADKIKQFAEEVSRTSSTLNWERIFSHNDEQAVINLITREMQKMGMSAEQIEELKTIRIKFVNSLGYSYADSRHIQIARLQVVIKALDYQRAFGPSYPLETILRSIITSTVGHELGHRINVIAGNAIDRIAPDREWIKNGQSSENKNERFAEFWGRLVVSENPELSAIREKEWLLSVAKVNQVWSVVAEYNNTHVSKVKLISILTEIRWGIDLTDNAALSLVNARIGLYSGNEPENYASPYSRDIVAQAVKQKEE